ncbi:hypothetical protein [Jeongeupia naejangsanensis]|uniref:Uncharacterized protein n=1 Tax=Jeongeupia naejangsanensis TaxID=613195 RepID=A0ABS2BKH3_9NEIS|nr:hypothetical protein [Jeongeupia naejangsanensis]MBM3115324.1 hypothetical protein [Jeongeupia naejangsanensis]
MRVVPWDWSGIFPRNRWVNAAVLCLCLPVPSQLFKLHFAGGNRWIVPFFHLAAILLVGVALRWCEARCNHASQPVRDAATAALLMACMSSLILMFTL